MPTISEGFDAAKEVAIADRLRPGTLRVLGETRRRFIEVFGPDAELPVDLKVFKRANVNLSPVTVNKFLRTYKRMCNIVDVAAGKVEMLKSAKKRPDTLNQQEIEQLISASGRLYPLVLFAAVTASRRVEIATLRWADVDLERRRATIRDAKSGDERIVPLSHKLVEVLREIHSEQSGKLGVPPQWVFWACLNKDVPYNLNALSNVLTLIFQRAGLGKNRRGLHTLRKTFATRACEKGVAMKVAMSVGGWKQTSTMLNYYVDVSEESMQDAIDKLAGE